MEVLLQLLPRSSTGERMNPYTSMWTGAVEGQAFHLVFSITGVPPRSLTPMAAALFVAFVAPPVSTSVRSTSALGATRTVRSIPDPLARCSRPNSLASARTTRLPFASTLCGACLEVCPVKIDMPSMLVHLRTRVVEHRREESRLPSPESLAMSIMAEHDVEPASLERRPFAVRRGRLVPRYSNVLRRVRGPWSGWVKYRDLPTSANKRSMSKAREKCS